MSDLLQKFTLNKEAFFNQPKEDFERTTTSGVNDPNTVVNLADRVHNGQKHSGTPHSVKNEDIDNNLVNATKNEVEVDKNPVEGVQDILQTKPKEFTGGSSATRTVGGSSEENKNMIGGGSDIPEASTGGSDGGAIAFSAKTLGKGKRGRPKKAGALAFNDEELVQQIKALKKGDKIGSGAVAAAAISSLISAAPAIIDAIGKLRKGKGYTGAGELYVKNLSPDKFDTMENLMKQINRQKKYFKFDENTNEYEVGSGKFGDFMSKAWSKLKDLYNSEGFQPIKNALLNAASNTASKYIDKAANKIASKTQNEDVKNIIEATRDVAHTAKDNIIESGRGAGMIFNQTYKGGQAEEKIEYLRGGNRAIMFDKLADDEIASDDCSEDELVNRKNDFKKKSVDYHPNLPNNRTKCGNFPKIRARSVFL